MCVLAHATATATAMATKRTMVLVVAVAILVWFRLVPAAQRWWFAVAVHLVDSLLRQHGGDLIPL